MIVSGGVYGSPQLLLLSGIGPGAHLQEMGIAVRARPAGGRRQPARPFQLVRRLARDEGRHAQRSRPSPVAQAHGRHPVCARPQRAARRRSARSPASSCAPTRASTGPTCRSTSSCGRSRGATATASIPHKWPGFIDLARASAARGARPRQPEEPRPAGAAEDRVQVPRDGLRHRRHALRRCGSRGRSPSSRRSKPYIAEEVHAGARRHQRRGR